MADVGDRAGDGVQQQSECGCGESGEVWIDERGEKCGEAEWHEDGDQRDAEHVGGQREDGGSVEVESHGENHDGFGDQADEDEFDGAEGEADEGCGETAGEAAG